MPTLKSSVLVIGEPLPGTLDLGFDHQDNVPIEKDKCAELLGYSLVITPTDELQALSGFIDLLKEKKSATQLILLDRAASVTQLADWLNTGKVHSVVLPGDEAALKRSILNAFEKVELLTQHENLLKLTHEQNDKRRKMNAELEDRVSKRQKSLLESRKRLLTLNARYQLLHQLMVRLQRCQSVGQIESALSKQLNGPLTLQWMRIFFRNQTNLAAEDTAQTILRLPLFEKENHFADLCFARPEAHKFIKEEISFFKQIAEMVSLAIVRVLRLDQIEQLKHQWETTFDAISSPLSIINEDYQITRCNSAFASVQKMSPEEVIGKKCHAFLFGRELPCEGCDLGQTFRVRTTASAHETRAYQVDSQKIKLDAESGTVYLQIYRDVTQQLQIERQIIESAKMTELGVIGSSIAHELNNPLGGIINFLQLIRMEIKDTSPLLQDIDEMERAAQRCKETIENLLGFVRQADPHEWRECALAEVLAQAVRVAEIQTRSIGIAIHIIDENNETRVRCRFNLLVQAFTHVLVACFDRLRDHRATHAGFKGEVTIRLNDSQDYSRLEFSTNSPDVESSSHSSFEITQRIVEEHLGQCDFQREKNPQQVAVIELPRLA